MQRKNILYVAIALQFTRPKQMKLNYFYKYNMKTNHRNHAIPDATYITCTLFGHLSYLLN